MGGKHCPLLMRVQYMLSDSFLLNEDKNSTRGSQMVPNLGGFHHIHVPSLYQLSVTNDLRAINCP